MSRLYRWLHVSALPAEGVTYQHRRRKRSFTDAELRISKSSTSKHRLSACPNATEPEPGTSGEEAGQHQSDGQNWPRRGGAVLSRLADIWGQEHTAVMSADCKTGTYNMLLRGRLYVSETERLPSSRINSFPARSLWFIRKVEATLVLSAVGLWPNKHVESTLGQKNSQLETVLS